MRTFVAIEIEDALRKTLERLQSRLRDVADGARWVRPELMHLTLKFCGEINDPDAPTACEAVACCAGETAPFRLTFTGADAFPHADRPRVLWVGAADDPPVMGGLHKSLDSALSEVGVPRENRRFSSHLTIARFRRPRPMPGLAEALNGLAERVFGEMDVTEIVLMQSELTPSGPLYTPLSRAALAG